MTLAWFFQTPARLRLLLAGGGVLALCLVTLAVSVRLSTAPEREPVRTVQQMDEQYAGLAPGDVQFLPEPAAPTVERQQTVQELAVQAVEKTGRAAGLTTVQAQDGALVVVEVLTNDGPCSVTLIQDAQSLITDEVKCT